MDTVTHVDLIFSQFHAGKHTQAQPRVRCQKPSMGWKAEASEEDAPSWCQRACSTCGFSSSPLCSNKPQRQRQTNNMYIWACVRGNTPQTREAVVCRPYSMRDMNITKTCRHSNVTYGSVWLLLTNDVANEKLEMELALFNQGAASLPPFIIWSANKNESFYQKTRMTLSI